MKPRDQILARIAVLQAELSALMNVVLQTNDGDFAEAPRVVPPAPRVIAPAPVKAVAAPAPKAALAPAPAADDDLPPEPGEDKPEPKIERLPAVKPTPRKVAPAPAPEPAPEPRRRKVVRWRYQPGTWYALTGASPFRNGNNFNLFNHIEGLFGDKPFSRTHVAEAIAALRANGQIESSQTDEQLGLIFLRQAGQMKGRIDMVPAPAVTPEPAAKPKAKAKKAKKAAPAKKAATRTRRAAPAASDEDNSDTLYTLSRNPFRSGINLQIVTKLGLGPFKRDELADVVTELVDSGKIKTSRAKDAVVRDFLGRVQERGVLRSN